MSRRQRKVFHVVIITAGLSLCAVVVRAQALRPVTGNGAPLRPAGQAPAPGATLPVYGGKPSTGLPATQETATPIRSSARSMLDEPASPAQIEVSGDKLSIRATNASLSEVIRQVANKTGMQVEGNSHDQRVYGVYGPGSPPEVLSALLYDSGYNVMMVGSTADGVPRRLVLSARTAGAASSTAAPSRSNDEDDDETPQETPAPPPPPLNPGIQVPPPSAPGQPKTPQQMLEELQRMHQGQQPPDVPKEVSPN